MADRRIRTDDAREQRSHDEESASDDGREGVRVARHSSFFTILERMRMNAVTTHGTRRKQLNVRFEEDMRGLSVAR